MLDPWIIEEIKKREEEKRREQPTVPLEIDQPPDERDVPPTKHPDDPEEGNDRGVVIIGPDGEEEKK